MTFRQKWENYWYHYKGITIGLIFIILLSIVGLKSCVDREETDFHAVYISDRNFMVEADESLGQTLENEGIIKDIDGDGKCNFYLDSIVMSFDADANNDQATLQKLQTILYAGQHTLVLAHEYALEDFDGSFEDITDRFNGNYPTYKSPSEGFVSGISVSGNTFLEERGIPTDNLYLAVRRQSNKEAEENANAEKFDMAYDVMEYILSFNPQDE